MIGYTAVRAHLCFVSYKALFNDDIHTISSKTTRDRGGKLILNTVHLFESCSACCGFDVDINGALERDHTLQAPHCLWDPTANQRKDLATAGGIVSWLLGDMACSHESWRDEWNSGVSLELFRMRSTHKLAVLGQLKHVHL